MIFIFYQIDLLQIGLIPKKYSFQEKLPAEGKRTSALVFSFLGVGLGFGFGVGFGFGFGLGLTSALGFKTR
jgi:hypothetical protein